MEDKLTIRVPQRRFGGGEFTDQSIANNQEYGGDRMGACGALNMNLIQFMTGSPVVEYSSVTFSGDLGGFDGQIQYIDTTRPQANATAASFDSSTAYSHYTDNLMHNRAVSDGWRSVASGTFTIESNDNGTYHVTHPTLGDSSNSDRLYNVSGGEGVVSAGTQADLYNVSGHFVLSICITATSSTEWPASVTCTFDVTNPDYTDALNWADMSNTSRLSATATSWDNTLHYDAGRIQGLDPSDAMGLYDMQGLSFKGRNIDTRVYPVATLHRQTVIARGGFGDPISHSAATNTIGTQFGAGRAVGGPPEPAPQANRAVDYFTILRGPGYVRMYGQVSDPATGEPDPNEADKDTAYFFGMMRPYETAEDHPHPMAFLGDVGFRSSSLANRTRPFWRASFAGLATDESDIWEDNFDGASANYWRLSAPFILGRTFVMGDSSLNTPAQAKAFLPKPGTEIGRWYQRNNADPDFASTTNNGSTDDSKQFVVSAFDGAGQATAWDVSVQWSSPLFLTYKYLESPIGPRILPLTLRQYAPDDHSWPENHGGHQTDAYGSFLSGGQEDFYENIGEIPGMSWVSERECYDGSTPTYYSAGTEIVMGGRTYRMAVGFSQSSNSGGAYTEVTGREYFNSGNLLFDMNEL